MNLIVDVGNTNIKIGLFQKNKLLKKIRYDLNNKDELHSIFLDFPKINYVFFCGHNRKLKEQIQNIIDDTNVILIDWKNVKKNMIHIEYNTLNTLGFDRLAVSIGAVCLYPEYKNHLVIDIGSCITYDIILKNSYKGGQISPGINLRLKSLESFTNNLPNLEFSKPSILLGQSTIDSMQSGVFFGICDEIKSRIKFYKKEISDLNIILTGGDSLYFKKTIKNALFDDNLLMKGLNLLLNYNVER